MFGMGLALSNPTRSSSGIGSYEDEILADSPFRWYRMDETTGSVAYDSGSDGVNATYGSLAILGASPVINSGYSMEVTSTGTGAATACVAPDSAAMRFTSGDMGMGSWIQTTSSTTAAWIAKEQQGAHYSAYVLVYDGSSKKCFFSVRSADAPSEAFRLTSTSIVGDGNKNRVFVRRSGDVYSLLVNGVVEASVTSTARPYNSTGIDVGLGCETALTGFGTYAVQGKTDEYDFYTHAVSDARCMAHYLAGL